MTEKFLTIIVEDADGPAEYDIEYTEEVGPDGKKEIIIKIDAPGRNLITGAEVPPITIERFTEYLNNIQKEKEQEN